MSKFVDQLDHVVKKTKPKKLKMTGETLVRLSTISHPPLKQIPSNPLSNRTIWTNVSRLPPKATTRKILFDNGRIKNC